MSVVCLEKVVFFLIMLLLCYVILISFSYVRFIVSLFYKSLSVNLVCYHVGPDHFGQ